MGLIFSEILNLSQTESNDTQPRTFFDQFSTLPTTLCNDYRYEYCSDEPIPNLTRLQRDGGDEKVRTAESDTTCVGTWIA